METILFFEPRLLRLSKEKKNPKNGKVWDIDKIQLLRRILDGRQIQLVLTSFNVQKDAALVSLFNSFRICPRHTSHEYDIIILSKLNGGFTNGCIKQIYKLCSNRHGVKR